MERAIKFCGFCKTLSMENRTQVYLNGKSWFPVSVRLRLAREWAGYDYEGLARCLGCHRTSVMRYETEAIKTIDLDRVRRWAEICKVPYDWILNGGPSGSQKLDHRATVAGYKAIGYPITNFIDGGFQ